MIKKCVQTILAIASPDQYRLAVARTEIRKILLQMFFDIFISEGDNLSALELLENRLADSAFTSSSKLIASYAVLKCLQGLSLLRNAEDVNSDDEQDYDDIIDFGGDEIKNLILLKEVPIQSCNDTRTTRSIYFLKLLSENPFILCSLVQEIAINQNQISESSQDASYPKEMRDSRRIIQTMKRCLESAVQRNSWDDAPDIHCLYVAFLHAVNKIEEVYQAIYSADTSTTII
jgi:hypothetical protein